MIALSGTWGQRDGRRIRPADVRASSQARATDPYAPQVPIALGRHLLFREISKGGWLAIVLVIAVVLLLVYWPRIAAWIEQRWFKD